MVDANKCSSSLWRHVECECHVPILKGSEVYDMREGHRLLTHPTFGKRSLVGFGLALVTLAAVGVAQYKAIQMLSETDQWVARTNAAMVQLEGTYAGLQRAEAGARGYVSTGREEYLAQYQSGISSMGEHLAAVRNLAVDNPVQRQNLHNLEPLLSRKVEMMRDLINLRRSQGFEAAGQELGKGEGLRLMNETRSFIDAMAAHEKGLLEVRQAASRTRVKEADAEVILGTILALVFLFAAAWLAYRDGRARAHAERRLSQANAYNRSLIEASLDPLVTIAPDGKITDVNSATETVTGRSRQELIGTDFSDNFTDPGKARLGYQQVFREGSVRDYALEIRHHDGRLTPVLYNASIYRDENGEVTGVFAAARDISEQRRAAEAVRRANAYNRSLLEASLDPLVTISPDGKITDVNSATEKVTGHSRGELVGTDFCDYFTDPEKARAGYQQVFREGFVHDYELEIRHRDGRLTPVLYNATVYRDEAEQVIGIFAAARDITQKKRAQQVVEAERQRFNNILESLPAYLVLLTPDYHVPFANRFFRERFGDAQGRRCYEYLFGRTEPCEICETYTVLKTAAPHQWEWTGPDGRNYDIHDFPFTDSDGSPLILEMGIDITERRQAEQEVRKLNESLERRVRERTAELEAANKELEAFTYSVSHDLRAPLRHVDGFSKLLVEEHKAELSPPAQEYLAIVRDSVKQMGVLIDDLLNLGRVGRMELKVEVTGLNSLVQEAVKDLTRANPQRAIDWKIQTLPFLECDPSLMKLVFANLLSNAVKFTRPRDPAVIEVGTSCQDGRSVIFVRDNGVGFSMKYVDKLFGVFQRLHRAEDFEGTGVGLATVQRIIHKHGGHVWAEGELDKGATFCFTLGTRGAP